MTIEKHEMVLRMPLSSPVDSTVNQELIIVQIQRVTSKRHE